MKVKDVIKDDVSNEPPRNVDQAQDALTDIEFDNVETEGPETHIPAAAPITAPKKKRLTKAELEAENSRLAAEVEAAKQQAAATAPGLIESMYEPLALTFKAGFNVMASWKGTHWELAEPEAQGLGKAWAPVVGPLLAKYPNAILYAAAIATTYSVVKPRLDIDKRMLAEKEADVKYMREREAKDQQPTIGERT